MEKYPDNDYQTTDKFDITLMHCLGDVACMENLKDNLPHWIQHWKKPFDMELAKYIAHRKQLHRYAEGD